MPYNLIALGANIGPDVVETFFSHYLNRKPLKNKPTAELSYHEGLRVIRRFLFFASHHTVEEIQGFTSPSIPHAPYVRVEGLDVPQNHILQAIEHLTHEFGPQGIDRIGGPTWWQWRSAENPLKADWIEMRRDFNARKQKGQECKRCIMYIHGGAYFFGSVDEHRYQMERHARKLQARVFAPRYRLSPQYPFPVGLLDCLSTYLFLLTVQDPSTILIAGDSAGGGMAVALMTLLRNQGLPLPAGAILLSPWVDLTHSFPSLSGDGSQDYVPAHGFIHRPSMAWPPPNSDDMSVLNEARLDWTNGSPERMHRLRHKLEEVQRRAAIRTEAQGFTATDANTSTADVSNREQSNSKNLSIMIDGRLIEIKDQIQMYTTNDLLTHPLVSPVLAPSLGGLPPLLILVGGGELLRDEQIYLAHKAANPSQYLTADFHIDTMPDPAAARASASKWPPTNVQLQVWDDLCHVAPTLSFTRPAKCMYRSVAQFGAFALSRAQKGVDITIPDDYDTSEDESSGEETDRPHIRGRKKGVVVDQSGTLDTIGHAGDQIPPFHNHMVRQRVTRRGVIYPLEPASELVACAMAPEDIGMIKEGPVRKWMAAQTEWAKRYGKIKRRVQERRLQDVRVLSEKKGSLLSGEDPPPTSVVWRKDLPQEAKRSVSKLLAMWSGWGGKHDEHALGKEEKMATEDEGMANDEKAQPPRSPEVARSEPVGTRRSELPFPANELAPAVLTPGGTATRRARFRSVSYAGQFEQDEMQSQTGLFASPSTAHARDGVSIVPGTAVVADGPHTHVKSEYFTHKAIPQSPAS